MKKCNVLLVKLGLAISSPSYSMSAGTYGFWLFRVPVSNKNWTLNLYNVYNAPSDLCI